MSPVANRRAAICLLIPLAINRSSAPWIGPIVIARCRLPVPQPIFRQQFDLDQPLEALVEVSPGSHRADRTAMLERNRLPRESQCNEDVEAQRLFNGNEVL